MSCAKLPFFAPRFSAIIAFADSEPKLIAEMLKIDIEYGCARFAPTTTRKSWPSSFVGTSEWLMNSWPVAFTSISVP